MKKIAIIVLLLSGAVCVNAQLLYRISGNGLKKASYVIGTQHLARVSFVDSIAGLKEALESVDQVYGELNSIDFTPEQLQAAQEAMMMPDGKTLRSVLTEDETEELNIMLTNMLGMDMDNPQLGPQLDMFNPSALTTQLSVMIYMMEYPGEYDPQNQFDNYFLTYGKQHGKKVGGLESFEYQIEVLYGDTNMEEQVKSLMCFVGNTSFQLEQIRKVVESFYRQDLKAIEAAFEMKIGNECDPTDEEMAKLLSDRNDIWLKQMPEIMNEGATFFVVGAGHLVTDKGLLQQLMDMGYSIEAVSRQ